MKQSNLVIPTLKEIPADADCASHQYLLRGGYIRQTASGIYSYLTLGYRVIQKIQSIVREEMDKAGAVELLMPAIQPAELWRETGRWNIYGPELMRLQDRHGRDFALGPTHEELITSLMRDELNSYKKLPKTLFQIQTKYRDERRPRFGLLRGREFIMKDAYSFHESQEGLSLQYEKMYEAYRQVFTRCGLDFRPVIADSGAIGGKDTHEFMALAEIGEDTIAYSDQSDYAANIEMTDVLFVQNKPDEQALPLTNTNSVDDSKAERWIDYEVFKFDQQIVVVLKRKDEAINDVKLKHYLNVDILEEVSENVKLDLFNLDEGVLLIADQGLKNIVNGIYYDRKKSHYTVNVNPERDFDIKTFGDFRFIKEGDPSPDGKGVIKFAKGIEIGQVFKLGTKYSEPMNATFLDENGKSQPLIMGCYGIGVSRTMAAVAEQHHDTNGLIWPRAIAPFDIHIITVNTKNQDQVTLSESLYNDLSKQYDVLLDDRKERAGVKFADADLIGCPLRITVGKKANESIVEVKNRKTGDGYEVPTDQLASFIDELLN